MKKIILGPQNLSVFGKKPEKASIFELKRSDSPVKSILGRKRN